MSTKKPKNPMYCEHDRTADACEQCLYEVAKNAGRPVPAELYQESGVTEEPAESAQP